MPANWNRLTEYLLSQGDTVELTWGALEDLVGGLPSSAANHGAWWYGDRPQVRAWRRAGFVLQSVERGVLVRFSREHEVVPDTPPEPETPSLSRETSGGASSGIAANGDGVLLVTCVKSKLDRPAPAKELYDSALFSKMRAYAEETGRRWFILSAEHGLVDPEEWLSPYERYLPSTPRSYRQAWGAWVAAKLELLLGDLTGLPVEIHAGAAYVDAVRPHLLDRQAEVSVPLQGLDFGSRLSWYGAVRSGDIEEDRNGPAASSTEVAAATAALSDEDRRRSPQEVTQSDPASLQVPGLYSWWVDEVGAEMLAQGLRSDVSAGLIYAGQAGATRWPSGTPSGNTLWTRIVGMHLGGRARGSTFRLTLGSVLSELHGWDAIDEARVTQWMREHLSVIAYPVMDADGLGTVEEQVLVALDPPLNLQGMPSTPLRLTLTHLRRKHSQWSRGDDAREGGR